MDGCGLEGWVGCINVCCTLMLVLRRDGLADGGLCWNDGFLVTDSERMTGWREDLHILTGICHVLIVSPTETSMYFHSILCRDSEVCLH